MNLITESIKNKRWPFLAACFLFFMLSACTAFSVICFALFAVVLLFSYRQLKFQKENVYGRLMMIIFFLSLCVGLFFTTNLQEGYGVVERKLAFLIFPIVFMFVPSFTKKEGRVLFLLFTLGAIVEILLSAYKSFECWETHHWMECFYSSLMSHELHPSYQALFDVTIITYFLYRLITDFKVLSRIQIAGFLIGILFFSVFMIFLASKGGFLSLLLLFFLASLYFAYLRKKIFVALAVFVTVSGLAVLTLFYSPIAEVRFKSAFHAFTLSEKELFDTYKTTTESTPARLMIWKVAREILEVNPMGVGTGDVQDALMEGYRKREMTGAIENKLNAHSQYYQTAIGLGILGFIILLLVFIVPIIIGFKKKNFLLIALMFIFMVNLLVEAMFERMDGIVFFCIFTCFLLMNTESQAEEITKTEIQ